MTTLHNKIDFAVILRVKNANPNGDPLNGNRPRTDYSNFGEMTDVSIKRKIRDRLLERWIADGKKDDDGNMIFVQSDDRKADEAKRQIINALIGVVIVFATWGSLSFVGNFFGIDFTTFEIPTL